MKKSLLTTALLFLISGLSFGQILTFENSGLSGGEVSTTSNFNHSDLNSSTLSRGAGINTSNNGGRFNANSHSTEATLVPGDNSYFTFNVTPKSGFSFSLTSIVFNFQRSGTGPKAFALRSSADSFASDLGTAVTIADETTTKVLTFTFALNDITADTEFRLYTYNAESTSGSGGIGDAAGDDIIVNGTVTSTGGAATKLVVTAINSSNSPSTGSAFDVTIQAQDASDIPANVDGDVSITLSKASGTGALGGTLTGTITDGTNSVTISGVTYDTAESGVSITATDDATTLTAGTSATFTVLSAADQLVIKDFPSTGYSTTTVSSFTVEAQRSGDSSIDEAYDSDITIAKVSGSGTLGGTLTQTAVNGVATFDDVTFSSADSYVVNAGDGSLTSANSSSITVTTAVAPTAGSVYITEVSDAATDFNSEFIELYNSSSSDVTLGSTSLLMYASDGTGSATSFSISGFSGSSIIPANGFLIIARGATQAEFVTEWGALEANTNFNEGSAGAFFGTGRRWVLKESTTVIDSTTISVGNGTRHFQAPLGSQTFIEGVRADATPGLLDMATTLTGVEGWRFISSPVVGPMEDLLDPIWTQGIASGADVTTGDPNVFGWDNSTLDQEYSAISNLSGSFSAGLGYLVYVYADDNYDGSADAFPKTLSISGTENAVDASPSLIGGNNSYFYLVGNPFASTIDFDAVTKTDLTDVAYVWDPNSETGNEGKNGETASGSWKSWNGTTGDITDGLIAPFQGFFIQGETTGFPSPEITFGAASKSTGGTFLGKANTSTIAKARIKVSGANTANSMWVQFSNEGSATSHVKGDAVELQSLDGSFAELAAIKGGELFDIAHLPIAEEVSLPISFRTTEGGTYTFTASNFEIPSSFSIVFHDYETGKSMTVDENFSYEFEATAIKQKSVPVLKSLQQGPIVAKANTENRFGLVVTQKVASSNEIKELPSVFALDQNYPNPFNPTTTIKYSVAKAGEVHLSVYNMMGQKVTDLVSGTKQAGNYAISWNAEGMASGMYFYRLSSAGQTITRQMTLIK